MRLDAAERLLARQQRVEGIEFAQRSRLQWLSHVPADEAAAPLAQLPRLTGHAIELARFRTRPDVVEHAGCDVIGLRQPVEKPFAVRDPVDLRIDGRGDRIEKIETTGVGDENGGRVKAHGCLMASWAWLRYSEQ